MTIKKIALSTVATAMITTGVFAANTLTVSSQSVGAEGVTSAKAYLNDVDVNATLTADLLGSLTAGSVIYTFKDAAGNALDVNSSNAGQVRVWLDNNTSSSAVTDFCSNGTTGQIICTLSSAISSGNVLILADDNTSAGFELLDINTTAGFTGATVSVQLADTGTNAVGIETSGTFLTTATQWSASVGTGFNAQIDASDSFLSFNGQTDDNATITVTETTVDKVAVATPAASWITIADRNVSTFGAMADTSGAVTGGLDNNYTSAIATLAAGTYNLKFTPNGTVALEEASFTTGLSATFNSNVVNLITAGTSLGAFTTYGYTGNIVGASYSAGTTDTVITLLNNQSTASADTVITITDADGDNCILTSADSDTGVTKPTANSSTKYTLSTMLGDTACSALTGTSFAIKVVLPTTPTNVFANAFVKRSDVSGAFKVLPVYNNGTKY